jgi:site-specific recombinase XerD
MASIKAINCNKGITKYYGDFRVDGKRYRRYLGLSKKTAIQALQKLEYELRYPTADSHSAVISYSEAVQLFLKHVELTGITYAHIKYIGSRIKAFQWYCAGKGITRLFEVKQDTCTSYIKTRSQERIQNFYRKGCKQDWKHPAISTLNREIGFQKRFYLFCVHNDWIHSNPWLGTTRLKDTSNEGPRYAFSSLDIEMIFKNAGNHYDFYYFLLHTGLRSTDAFSLQSSSFDGDELTLQMKKTGDWLRVLPISGHVIGMLGNRLKNSDLIFPEYSSDRQRRNVRRYLQNLFAPAVVREYRINLHTFRHTYARSMLNKGVPKEVVQTFLGHRSIRTTERYTNWISNSHLRRWV